MKQKAKVLSVLTDIAYLVFGCFLYGLAYNMFFLPGEIYVGGASGIASALFNSGLVTFLPVGTMIIIINVPLLLLFTWFYGIRASIKSIVGVVLASLSIDFFDLIGIFPPGVQNPQENGLLCAILGSVILGAGLGILFMRGFTTGGSDILGLLLRIKYPKLSPSVLIFVSDIVIILFAAITTHNYMSILYSAVAIFGFTSVLDIVTKGFEKARFAFIFSDSYERIADEIATAMGRGVTVLNGTGWYTKQEKKVLLCVVKRGEIYTLKQLIRRLDPAAFVILGEAAQTIGRGFSATGEALPLVPKDRTKKK